jgi:hypothetical protein
MAYGEKKNVSWFLKLPRYLCAQVGSQRTYVSI